MTIDNDALIREVEAQRDFMAARAARFAALYAATQSDLVKAETALKAAQDTIAAQESAERHKAE